MILHVKRARYLHDYVLWVRFSDGAEGEVNLAGELDGEVFEPLKDIALFKAFRVDPELETIVWPNEADLAPEFLREKLTAPPKDAVDQRRIPRKGQLEPAGASPVQSIREKRALYRIRRSKKRA
jgi:hypothetical protein